MSYSILDTYLEPKWHDWQQRFTQYLDSKGVNQGSYDFGYHEGQPTIYFNCPQTWYCLWDANESEIDGILRIQGYGLNQERKRKMSLIQYTVTVRFSAEAT